MKPEASWRPTTAHTRALIGGLLLAVVAVLGRRPDLLVIATPLAGAAVWAAMTRPSTPPTVHQSIDHRTLYEGQATTWRVSFDDPEGRVDDVAVVLAPSAWTGLEPTDGQVVVDLRSDGDDALKVAVGTTRWGCRRVGPALIVASSGWAGFCWSSRNEAAAEQVVILPQLSQFDAAAPGARTAGLIGSNRSLRYGGGAEFATIRPFQPGDRLRRIHWARSLRTGTLHVASTWADQDRHIVLIIDALEEVGDSEGIGGRASSLDITVRAAGAIAEHYVGVGDRVGLLVFGARGVQRLRPAAGSQHLRRLLGVLADIRPAHALADDGRLPRDLGEGALVLMLSPLTTPAALQRAAAVAGRGMPVLVIDCLPTDITQQDPTDPYAGIAWRIALLQRERDIRRAAEAGIAVVPWRGPGSLDVVLRDMHRRSLAGAGRRR